MMIKPFAGTYPITQTFGANPGAYARFGLAGHNGVDWGVPSGTPIRAAEGGVVLAARDDPGGYGHYIKIDHGDGQTAIYGHLSRIETAANRMVERGQVIGYSGNTGNSTGPHLHFEIRVKGQERNGYNGAVDPLPLLDADPPRPPVGEGEARVTAEVLNIRLAPGGRDVGDLLAGDVLKLAGDPVTAGGVVWQPVVLWVAADWLEK